MSSFGSPASRFFSLFLFIAAGVIVSGCAHGGAAVPEDASAGFAEAEPAVPSVVSESFVRLARSLISSKSVTEFSEAGEMRSPVLAVASFVNESKLVFDPESAAKGVAAYLALNGRMRVFGFEKSPDETGGLFAGIVPDFVLTGHVAGSAEAPVFSLVLTAMKTGAPVWTKTVSGEIAPDAR